MFAINDKSLETNTGLQAEQGHVPTGNILNRWNGASLRAITSIIPKCKSQPPIDLIHVIACHRLEYEVVHKNTATQNTP